MLRPVCTAILCFLLSVLVITANLRWRQQAQFKAGEQGALAGDFMVALTGYESTIRMYVPLADTTEMAAARIWAMGLTAESRGDLERALMAFRSLRSALYGIRWFDQPGKEWIVRCDTKIAALAPLRKGTTP